MSKNVILKDKQGNQLCPATTAEQVTFNSTMNVKQAIGTMQGSPLIATSASDMTDTSRVYVYTGSETGYTSGNWYYYDGSDWVSGGVYNAVAVETDTTLTESGVPADSATVGKYIHELGSDTVNLNTVGTGRTKLSNGSIVSANNNYIGLNDKIPCDAETYYSITFHNAEFKGSTYVHYFDSNGTVFNNYDSGGENIRNGYVIKTPENASYLYVYRYGTDLSIDGVDIQIEKGKNITDFVKPFTAFDNVSRNGYRVGIDPILKNGYINANGTMASQGSSTLEKTTEKIQLSLYSDLVILVSYSEAKSLWLAVGTYDADDNFIERKVLVSATTDTWSNMLSFDSAVASFVVSYRSYGENALSITGKPNIEIITNTVADASKIKETGNHNTNRSSIGFNPLRFKPCYDHLFVSDSVITVPHESVYHIRLSRLLGFNVIEANTAKTSDNVYVVNHFSGGKFGNYFVHVDGVTDISNVAVSSVTWDWIVSNVRYNTTIPKYRTRPSRLEEFLKECRQQNIIPFVQGGDSAVVSIAEKYMGKDNFISYGSDRSVCPSGIIYKWSSLTSKDEIIAYCESIGKPLIYGMSNPTAFTDSELREIIDELHQRGFWIGTSYADDNWYKYLHMGFDINGTQTLINRIDVGNLENIDTIFGFDSFTFTNAIESDGVLTFTSGGTITPDINVGTLTLGGVDLQIDFVGTITIPSMGRFGERTIISDGSYPVFIATPCINVNPVVTMSVTSGTVIKDIKLKISKF